jgi:transcriptional regulator with XRE-family HTH domain
MGGVPDVFMAIGRCVRELRKARRWSQEELAHRAGISRTFMGSIEQGAKQPSVMTLVRLARALGVGAGALFPPSGADAPRESREILARIQGKLAAPGRSTAELRRLERLVDAFLKG